MKKIYKMLWLLALLAVMPVANVVAANVAKIGTTQYASLQAAFDAVADGQTIILTADITQDDGCKFDRAGVSAKLNLNNKTLTVNEGSSFNYRAIRIDNGTLEVYDGTINAVGSGTTSSNGTGCYGAFRVEANGKLVAKNLTLSNARPWGLNVKVLGGEAELTNVTINSSYGGGIEVTEAELGTQSKKGKATLTNCTFTQTGYFDHCSTALSVSGGSELVVNSGSYTSENYVIYVFSSGGDVTVNGGDFTATGTRVAAFKAAIDTKTYPEYTGGMKLNDGNFVGNFEIDSPASTVVTGGIYTADVTAYMPTGATSAQNTDGSYTINPVAVVNGINYSTLADAIAAVPDGTETTITMVADEAIVGNNGPTIATTKNVVLDLNGKTLTLKIAEAKSSAFITNQGQLTITDNSDAKNGKITNDAAEGLNVGNWPEFNFASNIITNSGTLNIEGGTIQNTAKGSICYAIDNNSTSYDAVLNINGGYLTAVGTVVRQFCNSTTKQNVLNVSGGTVETNGSAAMWTQLPGSSSTSKKLATLNITGGTITGRNYAWYDWSGGDSFEAVSYNISGGTINGAISSAAVDDGVIAGFVSGGEFREPLNPTLCVTGKKCVEENGKYIVVDDSDPREPAGEFVYYYWYNSNNEEESETCAFSTPFSSNWLCDGEFIRLLTNITLTEDIACQLASGSFTLTQGAYAVTGAGYHISLLPGVSVVTDKQTDIFTAPTTLTETVNNGVYTYTAAPYVAQIGTTNYETLAAAIAAATDGQTITLLADVNTDSQIEVGKQVTLDLNGKKIEYTGSSTLASGVIIVLRGGDLTIDDSSTNHDGSIKSGTDAYAAIALIKKGEGETGTAAKLTVNNGTLEGYYYAITGNGSRHNTEITINGGTITATAANENLGIFHPQDGTLTITGGTITAYASAVEMRAGTLNLTGGNLTATATTYSYTANGSGSTTVGAAIAIAQHNTKKVITTTLSGGTLNGTKTISVVDAQSNDLANVDVTATSSFVANAEVPEGFKWEEQSGGTYTLVEDKFILVDGTDYTKNADEPVAKAVYKRTFGSNRVKKYQGWFIPFDYTITAADLQKFKFFKIDMIAHSAVPGEAGDPNKLWVHLIQLTENDVMMANKPYIFTPQEEVGEYEFITTNATLKALTTESVASCSTTSEEFNFYGVYSPIHPEAENTDIFYYMALSGQLSYATKTSTTVGANRWIFRVTPKSGQESKVAYSIGFVVNGEVEDDDVTAVSSAAVEAEGEVVGYYTLNGQKVSEPTKGVYVVKYANGTSKKVVF